VITTEEYLYLTDHEVLSYITYHEVGVACFEEGWIDIFGLITPKGDQVIEEYRNNHAH